MHLAKHLILIAAFSLLTACGQSSDSPTPAQQAAEQTAEQAAAKPQSQGDVRLQGSGASFPFPLYAEWFRTYSDKTDGVRVDYQAKGSGAGIRDLQNKVVDFAGSDAAMTDEELAETQGGVVLLPVTAGEIVLTYNLEGVDDLKLPRDVYPLIFTGEIEQWNDQRITAANPGVDLPDTSIKVVVRSDSSGTTYVFTGHLAEINSSFKDQIGQSKAPQWPKSSNFIKAPKNDGITATVKQSPGAIGYIEYGYAKLTKSPTAELENRSGNFVKPDAASGAAALASAEFPQGNLPNTEIPDLRVWVLDPKGADAYPIATFTWLMFPQDMPDDKAAAAKKLVEFTLTEGQKSADPLGYIPLPDNVVDKVMQVSNMIQ